MKKIRCGTCGKRFPVGSAHNSRTCGKPKYTPQLGSFEKRETPTITPPRLGLKISSHSSTKKDELQNAYARVKLAKTTNDASVAVREVEDLVKLIGIDINAEYSKPDGVEIMLVNRIVYSDETAFGGGLSVEKCFNKEGERVEGWELSDKKPVVLVKNRISTTTPEAEEISFPEIVFVNEEGYLESRNGNPARVVDGKIYEWCDNKGRLHNLAGPAYVNPAYHLWFVEGERTTAPQACEKAIRPDLTREEFYELCTHEDYVVKQLAAHNPKCPAEWRTLVEIMDG